MNTPNTPIASVAAEAAQLYHGCFDGLRGLEISMTLEQAQSCSHQGRCDEDVAALLRNPAITAQFDAMNPDDLREGLSEAGAWDEAEREDDHANRLRALWMAACDIRENNRE